MKDTKEEKKHSPDEKVNFQSLRKCIFISDCCANHRKCFTDLLYDELV